MVWTVLCFFLSFSFFSFSFFFIIINFFFYLPFSSSSGTPGLFCASRPIWMSLRSWLALCRQVSCEVLIPVCGGGGGCRKLTGLFPLVSRWSDTCQCRTTAASGGRGRLCMSPYVYCASWERKGIRVLILDTVYRPATSPLLAKNWQTKTRNRISEPPRVWP